MRKGRALAAACVLLAVCAVRVLTLAWTWQPGGTEEPPPPTRAQVRAVAALVERFAGEDAPPDWGGGALRTGYTVIKASAGMSLFPAQPKAIGEIE